ncbi:hypothetical protein HanXRQr2_Chr03g0131251 [Helianthus annuus]|uniref:Uncharacterized protein n=1 Tax=Helianthus annuus TaxID=4232 RepID=A0A9K3JJG5_HELAN|nr:hypothetical protein HanXRQr2_Chr03g0131251 [Helianthus annuus]KAJ0945431.1 hypothetical protein HanPSC8_Chr03g0128071 [Helianthus annuus]
MVKGVKGGHPFGLYRVSSGLVWVPDWVFSITRPNRPNNTVHSRLSGLESGLGCIQGSGSSHLYTYPPTYIYIYIRTHNTI